MRVGIGADLVKHLSGMGTYVRGVIRAVGIVDPGGDYTLFSHQVWPHEPIAGAERMRRVYVPVGNTAVRNGLTFPLILATNRVDVLHVQYMAPPFCPARIVVTVHDLIHEHHPEFYSMALVRQYRPLVPLTIRRAGAVLTVSEYAKREIVRRYCVPPEQVTVAHGGPDPLYRRIHDQARLAEVRACYGTGDRFILCVSSIERRKNLTTLISAYVRLRRADATRAKLVLVGPNEYFYDETFAAARDSGYADELIFTGHVPAPDLVALYNAADLFVYPSLYEGMGLPPLEAMACGTPVVTSNSSSIPEVVGDAALLVDPLDVEGLAAAIARVLDVGDLRGQLIARGLQRVTCFSWEKAGRAIVDVYRRVAGDA